MRPSASTKCFIKQRSSYLKIHLANRHTKSIEIKHRYSQTQFRALAAGCRGAKCDLGKELGGALCRRTGKAPPHREGTAAVMFASAKQPLNAIPIFCLFFIKVKTLFRFLLVSKNRY